MSGGGMGGAGATGARVRIKGRKASVGRFLAISIAFTLPWIIMLSQLGYYSKIYGPQVLLQLNLAFYLPSIPVLLAAGELEKLLDAELGRAASLAIRLLTGLAGCVAIAAYYPFMPGRLAHLLWLVAALGGFSSVAFSTSYQLVAWFRSADTIALGIGCVASGPVALAIQIALHIGTQPKHWQWIALFEVCAGLVVLGLLAAASLLAQYWGIISGAEVYVDPRGGSSSALLPLLDSAATAQEEALEREADDQARILSRMLTLQDPFQGFPFTTTPGMIIPRPLPAATLRRAASDDISDRRRHARSDRAAAAAEAGAAAVAAAAVAAAGMKHKQQQQQQQPTGVLLARASAPQQCVYTAAAAEAAQQQQLPRHLGDAAVASLAASSVGNSSSIGRGSSSNLLALADAPAAAAAAAAAAMQQYSGLPMVPTPRSGTMAGEQYVGSAGPAPPPGLSGAWFQGGGGWDAEQQQQQYGGHHQWLAGGGAPGSGGSGSPWSSRAASPTPPGAGTAPVLMPSHLGPAGAASAASASSRYASTTAATGSYVPDLPDMQLRMQQRQHQHQQLQQPLHHTLLGGSAPVMPLAASLLDEDGGGVLVAAAAAGSNAGGSSDDDEVEAAAQAGRSPSMQLDDHHGQQQQQVLPPSLTALKQQAWAHARSGSAASLGAASGIATSTAAATAGAASSIAGSDAAAAHRGAAMSEAGKGEESGSLASEFIEVLSGTWMVVAAALISSTVINCIFPFFTYVESSGLLGEFLPQVLFYTRMLSDIVGRLVPRKRGAAITSPAALLALAGGLLGCAAAFFVYLQVPPRMQHDGYALALVLVLWMVGGYINTMSYILAPSLVAPRVCTKASAIMALTYQVAHILGLAIATGLALALYGDISGSL